MAILNAPTVAPFTTSPITVASGATVTVGVYAATGTTLPASEGLEVWKTTPGAPDFVETLRADKPSTVLAGPGAYTLVKGATAIALGAYSDT